MSVNVYDLVKKHEGCRLKLYMDTTGHATIGYGRNLGSGGISFDEAELMLKNDINRVSRELGEYSWYRNAPLYVQSVLVDIVFNVGMRSFLSFHDTIAAITDGDYPRAASCLAASLWHRQVKDRAEEDEAILRGEIK